MAVAGLFRPEVIITTSIEPCSDRRFFRISPPGIHRKSMPVCGMQTGMDFRPSCGPIRLKNSHTYYEFPKCPLTASLSIYSI